MNRQGVSVNFPRQILGIAEKVKSRCSAQSPDGRLRGRAAPRTSGKRKGRGFRPGTAARSGYVPNRSSAVLFLRQTHASAVSVTDNPHTRAPDSAPEPGNKRKSRKNCSYNDKKANKHIDKREEKRYTVLRRNTIHFSKRRLFIWLLSPLRWTKP